MKTCSGLSFYISPFIKMFVLLIYYLFILNTSAFLLLYLNPNTVFGSILSFMWVWIVSQILKVYFILSAKFIFKSVQYLTKVLSKCRKQVIRNLHENKKVYLEMILEEVDRGSISVLLHSLGPVAGRSTDQSKYNEKNNIDIKEYCRFRKHKHNRQQRNLNVCCMYPRTQRRQQRRPAVKQVRVFSFVLNIPYLWTSLGCRTQISCFL